MGLIWIWGKTTNGAQTEKITPNTKRRKICIPKHLGTFLYYAREVDPKIMVALGSISSNQAKSNGKNIKPLNNCWITVPHIQIPQ